MMTADMFAPFAARFAPVAIIPSQTPDEALEELEYAVVQRGFKAIMLRGNQERPIPGRRKESIRRRLPGTAIPSPSIARMIMSRSGGAASTSAWL